MIDFFSILSSFFGEYGYIAVFVVLIACGLGVPIPEDITLIAGGVLAGLGKADVFTMIAVGLSGVLLGDGIMFAAGRIFGHRILKLPTVARVIKPKRYAEIQDKFDRYGNWVLFIARFLPGLRMPIYVFAGISRKISYLRFCFMDGLAACLSVPIWIILGAYGAKNIDWLFTKVHQFQSIMKIITVIFLLFISYYLYRRHIRIRFFRDNRRRIREELKKQK